jgi:hypothetical protein
LSGDGGDVGSIYFISIDVEMLGNKIHTLVAGNAGPAGRGGDGGTGGPGGDGGTNLEGFSGDGGSGGPGGEPGPYPQARLAGHASGIITLASSPKNPIATLANNDIWNIMAGQGANGSPGANGGDGGPGGDGGNGGMGGAGGLGADGGDGNPGGDNGTSEIIYTHTYTTTIFNNTLMDPTTPQALSEGGAGGPGGNHGANGAPDGGSGGSASDGSPGAGGNSAATYGIHHIGGEGNVEVVNNIIVNTVALPGSDSYSMADDAESEGHITVANNNHLAGWYAGEVTVNAGADLSAISIGPYTSDDPFFTSFYDHHLTAISPCVDAGDNNYANLPSTDFDGKTRSLDGNSDLVAVVDIGAYELGSANLFYFIPFIIR